MFKHNELITPLTQYFKSIAPSVVGQNARTTKNAEENKITKMFMHISNLERADGDEAY